ncbi:DUF4265 domain-containing protein [Actinomadura sp. ATCC 31491]|uniref:DUF4265 domain-containing protein n=1 Tax=Actinomadura luzonensis TaxID=2805427 RepID=A0ABT0FX94_9ACTN|nr:DUF4265 domain-containing protein [Actinomadura luzonensis]MCK2216783.1 DUF4265 domain-containing protein [Actinomadura luzonensis]
MKVAKQNYIARVDLAPFGFPGLFEQIWLGDLGGGMYEVRCIPFRVYGLALGDIVDISSDGSLISSLVRPSGRKVLRVLLIPSLGAERLSTVINSINMKIGEADLLFEWSGDRHVAIDVPADINVDDLIGLVSGYVERGEAFWEWGDAEPFRAS